jgi:hypothetical protein
MKKILLLMTLAVGMSYSAFADPCGTDGTTLADYITQGTCTLTGTDLTFSGFSYSLSGDTIPIPASDVTVVPTISGSEAGLVFNAPWVALSPDLLDVDIDYTVSCGGCEIDDWVLSMGGVALQGDAFADVGETSMQVPGPGLAVGYTATTSTPPATATFPPVGSLTVDKDLTIYGGSTQGTIVSKVSTLTNLFSTTSTVVPEPSLTILCAGLLGLLPIARRKFIR